MEICRCSSFKVLGETFQCKFEFDRICYFGNFLSRWPNFFIANFEFLNYLQLGASVGRLHFGIFCLFSFIMGDITCLSYVYCTDNLL